MRRQVTYIVTAGIDGYGDWTCEFTAPRMSIGSIDAVKRRALHLIDVALGKDIAMTFFRLEIKSEGPTLHDRQRVAA